MITNIDFLMQAQRHTRKLQIECRDYDQIYLGQTHKNGHHSLKLIKTISNNNWTPLGTANSWLFRLV